MRIYRTYRSLQDLQRHERYGRDYRIRHRKGLSGIAVMAPHAGRIEPGTGEIAEAVADKNHDFYGFEGRKDRDNACLHIPSRDFEEPAAEDILRHARAVLVIHGCRAPGEAVFLGGRDRGLIRGIEGALRQAGFAPERYDPRYPGLHPRNLCNRIPSGRGVQIEIPRSLRREMFSCRDRTGGAVPTGAFDNLVAALREALADRFIS